VSPRTQRRLQFEELKIRRLNRNRAKPLPSLCSKHSERDRYRRSESRGSSQESAKSKRSEEPVEKLDCTLTEIIRVPTELSHTISQPYQTSTRLFERKYHNSLERAKIGALREKFSISDIEAQKLESLLIKGKSVLKSELSYAKSIPPEKRVFVKILEEATID
jgi:hypothetical protein